MTREEARLILQKNLSILSFMLSRRISEAIKAAIEALSQPSLPSNLDEAAKKIVIQLHPSMEYSAVLGDRLTMGEIVELVKAGAEWMARQGSSFKVNVEEVPQGHWYAGLHLGGCAEEEENALKSINAKDGEEVIVQIRKK